VNKACWRTPADDCRLRRSAASAGQDDASQPDEAVARRMYQRFGLLGSTMTTTATSLYRRSETGVTEVRTLRPIMRPARFAAQWTSTTRWCGIDATRRTQVPPSRSSWAISMARSS
jgi:hypothetical protein